MTLWSSYSGSLSQFLFYSKAVDASLEIFKKHDKYDEFLSIIEKDLEKFFNKDKKWLDENYNSIKEVLDVAIEQRSRHYTSNLVK